MGLIRTPRIPPLGQLCIALAMAALAGSALGEETGAVIPQVDVAGIRLGMTLPEARAALKAQKLPRYGEWTAELSFNDHLTGSVRIVPNSRFVNVIAAWSQRPPSTAPRGQYMDGESYVVRLTPVPGKERVVMITHIIGYPLQKSIRLVDLEEALAKKYANFRRSGPSSIPASPLWNVGPTGLTEVGSPCLGHGSGLVPNPNLKNNFTLLYGDLNFNNAPNVVFTIDPTAVESAAANCGPILIREGSLVPNDQDPPEARVVQSYQVDAFSPTVAWEDAMAAVHVIDVAVKALEDEHKQQGKEQQGPKL